MYREVNWILHQIWKYCICCLRDVILKIERDLSNSKNNTSISGVKFSWTYLLSSSQPSPTALVALYRIRGAILLLVTAPVIEAESPSKQWMEDVMVGNL